MKNTTTEILLPIRKKILFFSSLFAALLEPKQKEEGNLQGITTSPKACLTPGYRRTLKTLRNVSERKSESYSEKISCTRIKISIFPYFLFLSL